MVYQDAAGEPLPVKTLADLCTRRQHILQGMQEAMGEFPETSRRVPLDVEVLEEVATEKYTRRRISFVAEPGDRVPAYLLIPKDLRGKAAAMLCLHQTTGIGKGEPAGLGGLPTLHYTHELAERGFVCIVPDYPSFGDYPYDFKTQGKHFASGSMKAIWNNIRAVDLLVSLPEVDSDRIGCIGHSLGGHNSLFTAAFDQRLKAVVTSCGFTAFHHYYEGKLAGWTSDRYMPRIRDVYGNDPDQVPFDFYEVLTAICPRSIFINAPLHDSNFEVTGVKKVVDEVGKAYDLIDARDNLVVEYPDSAHDFPDEVRHAAYAWLGKQLK
jgi:dienelactone hydrolase